jgi:hypothetical protein
VELYNLQERGVSGNAERNLALEWLANQTKSSHANNGWVYFLDDDNMVHPSFYSIVQQTSPSDMLIMNQVSYGQRGVPSPPRESTTPRCKVSYVDSASYVVPRKV